MEAEPVKSLCARPVSVVVELQSVLLPIGRAVN